MKIWIHLDGKQEGPYSLEELPLSRMTADTPVWYDGLVNWTKAGEAAATASLFASTKQETEVHETITEHVGDMEEKVTIDVVENEEKPKQEGALYDDQLRRIDKKSEFSESSEHSQWSHWSRDSREQPKCPPTYFAWSIIMTLLCCNPVGIVPIVTGFYTRQRWRNQNYEGARRLSHTTEWWIMITIVTCLMLAPLMMLVNS